MRMYLWAMAAALTAGCATSNAPATAVPEPVAAAAPAAAASAMPATQTVKKAANNSPESRAKKMGYKVVQRDGNPFFCKEVAQLGTRLTQTVCITPDQFEAVEQQAERNREDMRRKVGICSTPTGVCGG